MKLRRKLITLSIMKSGDWYSMYQVLKQDIYLTSINDALMETYLSELNLEKTLTILDENYPENLKDASMPPFVLFYQGDLTLLDEEKIGVIGGKRASDYGLRSVIKVVTQLVHKNCVILSGIQPGIEEAAHKRALKIGKKITVLSWGFNGEMNSKLRENQLILTEYPFGVRVSWRQYYRSYRLIQQLSDKVLVLELPKEDRRLHALKQTIYEAKPVFVLPDHYESASSKGSLSLINEGAFCLMDGDEVVKSQEIIT